MDSLTHFLSILGVLALLLHFYFKRIKANSKESNSRIVRAPEPSGALPLVGHLHLLMGKTPLARTLGAMADKHGPVLSVLLGSHRALLVSSWESVKECFTTNDAIFASRPVMAVSKYLGYDQAMFALAPYGPYWREIRKIVTLELLTTSRLEKLKCVRESEVDLCTKDLHLLCTKNGDLSGIFVVSDSIPWLEWMDIGGHVKAMKQTSKEIDAVLGRWVEEHVQKRKERDDTSTGEADFMDVMLSVLAEDTLMSGHKRDTIIKATTMVSLF